MVMSLASHLEQLYRQKDNEVTTAFMNKSLNGLCEVDNIRVDHVIRTLRDAFTIKSNRIVLVVGDTYAQNNGLYFVDNGEITRRIKAVEHWHGRTLKTMEDGQWVCLSQCDKDVDGEDPLYFVKL
jgi:hypothetical protein